MGFKFTFLCDLLSDLEKNRTLKASTASKNHNPDITVVTRWFATHRKRIDDDGTDKLALLSSIFPEKRVDRVYWLQESLLARVIGRSLLLGSVRREELDRWREPGNGDLAQCVENVMRQAENLVASGQEVTVEEIDSALDRVASRCRFSGPRVRRQHSAVDVDEALSTLYRRLSSRDAKWLTRMILKVYYPVIVPINYTLGCFHFLLPQLLLFQDSFDAALTMLSSEPMKHYPRQPERGLAKDLCALALSHLTPKTGIKIGRPDYWKARSIKHCCAMIGRRRMSLERKYDGEYCQIHIDLHKGGNYIQIFSKSGKDSTYDRAGIHQAINRSLRIGKSDCKFTRRCVLEGELLVWSDKQKKILDFHKLRRFISRSGTSIGTDNDSPPQEGEHLMMVFFDVLLVDDNICLIKPHRERRLLLKDLIQTIPGRADISQQTVIDFSRQGAPSHLEKAFSRSIVERWEGYVLKGSDDPYFSFLTSGDSTSSSGRWIKLKKDYIPGLGDTVDLALIGGSYDPREAKKVNKTRRLLWTHFHVGCLLNQEAVIQRKAKPKFRVIDVIGQHCMSPRSMQHLNQFGEFSSQKFDHENEYFDVESGHPALPPIDHIFKTPFVVEMMGSGFERPSNARYFSLRFPRILKIHCNRTFEEAASFSELQVLAEKARSVPSEELSQEEERWRQRLRGIHAAAERSQDTASSNSGSRPSSPSLEGSDTNDTSNSDAPSPIVEVLPKGMHSVQHEVYPGRRAEPADGISIYVDGTSVSTVPESSAVQRNYLAQNENLSGHQNPRKRRLESPDRALCKKPKMTERFGTSPRCLIANRSETVQDEERVPWPSGGPDTFFNRRETVSHDEPISMGLQTEHPHVQYLLKKVPVYISPNLSLDGSFACGSHQNGQSDAGYRHLEPFLQQLIPLENPDQLRQSYPHSEQPLGLFLIDRQCSLGEELSLIGNRLSKTLANGHRQSVYEVKVIFMDVAMLSLHRNNDNPRSSWRRIAEEYFYACLTWRIKQGPSTTERLNHCAESSLLRQAQDPVDGSQGRDMKPAIYITFDNRETEGLEQLASAG
ncbi:hypothetical protein ASPZODRAFT_60292 [Penicilliopsis zonata CBS 506.65]|uniref:ATP-dependent DNA ligase family profile domain-containing protein n=1 Tax=Penicilliopsis zonata CBS 506.65 TaxID=1073090 RepID=A0A1L9SPN0_9EURO|nr:hypothetical protein ASPZODRAFT_60292 [Penicilliopsis zonata CBS 506.65]OJJ49017.1 hypothetical protein ASPZODRAFT_60292 [Penicilliopsis zonata CBS 506.65]